MEASNLDSAGANYLKYYHGSPESLQHVADVKARYNRLVELATRRAVSELCVPFDVSETTHYTMNTPRAEA